MSAPRLYCPTLATGEITLDETEARHALRSLRLRPGDNVELFDGRGNVALGVLQPTDNDASRAKKRTVAAVVAVERVTTVPAPAGPLTLLVAACKGARLDWMVEKCTELGVSRLILTRFERSVVNPGETHLEKLRRTGIEACKQCQRAWLPTIESAPDVETATKRLATRSERNENAALLVAHPCETAPPLGKWLSGIRHDALHVTAVVGPEGGLTDAEVERLTNAGGVPISLGPHILRIETAAITIAAAWSCRS